MPKEEAPANLVGNIFTLKRKKLLPSDSSDFRRHLEELIRQIIS